MDKAEPTLLLTRPAAQSGAFLKACETLAGRRLPSVISPLFRIEPTGAEVAAENYATIIFTSGNGVRSVNPEMFSERLVATVGRHTAELARSLGADASALGEDVDGFVRASENLDGPVLLCRGVHASGDLAARLRRKGIQVDEVATYDQVAQPLNEDARRILDGEVSVVAPLFSARTAKLLDDQAPFRAPLTVVAMSASVAIKWRVGSEVVVAESPTADEMARCVVELL